MTGHVQNGRVDDYRRRKENLEVLLARVDKSLIQAGYEVPNAASPTPIHSGIQIDGRLSFRGEEKARELFRFLDEDHDGLLSFSDLRGLSSVTTELFPTEYSLVVWEAWQAKMADCDAILTNGLLNEDQFVRYKQYCEGKQGQSLERELQALRLPLLPQVLQIWKILNTAWTDYAGFIKGDLSGYLSPDGQISLDDLPLIMSSVGLYWPKATLYSQMLIAYHKRNTMDELSLNAYNRLVLSHPERFKQRMLQEFEAVQNSAPSLRRDIGAGLPKFLRWSQASVASWFFADRPQHSTPAVYKAALQAKYGIVRGLRKLRKWILVAEAIEENLKRRSTFSGLQPMAPDAATATGSATIGEFEDGRENIRARAKLNFINNVRQALTNLKLPSDTGSALMIDLLLRSNATELMINRAIRALRTLLGTQLHPELQNFRTYKITQVFNTTNDTNDAPIIRIAVIFRKDSSIDAFFARNRLGWNLSDAIADFTLEMACSVHLSDLVESPDLNMQHNFGLKIDGTVSVLKPLTRTLLERLRRAMDWTPVKRMVEQQANISTARRPSKASIFESRKHSASTYEDQELVKLMQAHAPKISAVVDKMIRRLRCLKDGAWHFQTTLARAVESLAGLFPFVKDLVGPDGELEDGFVHKKVSPILRQLQGELRSLASSVHEFHEREEKRKREEHQQALLLAESEDKSSKENQERQRVIEQLRRLNVKVENHAELWGGKKDQTPEDAVRGAYKSQMENNESALEALDACYHACLGIDGVSLFLGRAHMTVATEGLNIFDILPRPPNMMRQDHPEQQHTPT